MTVHRSSHLKDYEISQLSERNGVPMSENGQVLVWDNDNEKWAASYNLTPVYGGLQRENGAEALANSVSLVAGTLTSGTVASTQSVNQTYYQVQETAPFDIQFTFTGLTGTPVECDVVGRYTGNPAHDVLIYIWNYDTTAWVRITASAKDFPSSATDDSYQFIITPNTDYISGGEAKIRIFHDSAAVSSHYMYIDFIEIRQSSLDMANAGTDYQLTGLTALPSNQMTLDGPNGTVTIVEDGDYDFMGSISFSGTANTLIEGKLFVNDVYAGSSFHRRLGATGDVGSAAGGSILSLSASDVLKFYFRSDMDNSHITIDQMAVKLKKLDY